MCYIGGENVPDYKTLYFMLFNAITDALDAIRDNQLLLAQSLLILAQQSAEEAYISSEE